MRYGEFNTSQAAGVRLCRNVTLDNKHYIKGHTLTAEDVLVLKMFDIPKVFGVIFEEGDVDYRMAQNFVAAKICGGGLGYLTDTDGVCKIVAAEDGIFMADENRLDKFNNFNEHFILNTIAPYGLVKKGDIIAELEITPTLLSEAEVDDMLFRLSGNEPLLGLSEVTPKKAVLLYTHLLKAEEENMLFTSVVMKLVTNMDGLGLEFKRELNSKYDKDALADSLFEACRSEADVVFVLSPLSSSGYNNALEAGLKMVVDEIVSSSYPQVGASDLLIAQKGKTKIIILPHSYGKVDSSAIDSLIKHALFIEHLTPASFIHKRAGWLAYKNQLPEEKQARLIVTSNKGKSLQKANIAVVILAAGQGRRSGSNKLMVEDKSGQPMFLRAVKAAMASDAKPVFVVTGNRHEEMDEYLDKLDVNVLYNASFASGVKTSINMGLKAVPSSCDGAILLPADMPYITAADLNKLIAKFKKGAEKQIVLFTNKGVKSNPVLWSKALYDKADIIPENAQFRVVFAEHADYTKTIEPRDKSKLRDINFPNDVVEFSRS